MIECTVLRLTYESPYVTLMSDIFMNGFIVSFVMRLPGCFIITFVAWISDIFPCTDLLCCMELSYIPTKRAFVIITYVFVGLYEALPV